MSSQGADWKTYKCRQCGKKFDVLFASEWCYKLNINGRTTKKMFCSWSCIQAYRKANPKREHKSKEMPKAMEG